MPRSAFRQLELAVRHQEPEQVREELARLAPELGADVDRLLHLDDELLVLEVHGFVTGLRGERRARRRAEALCRANAQLKRLQSSTRTCDANLAVLDPLELLHPDLVRAPGMRFLELAGPGVIVVALDVLRRARPLLLPKPDLTAYLDAEALHLRWNLGRGGLDLRRSRPLVREDRQRTLSVDVALPVVRPAGAWLGDMLTDFGWVS